MTPPTPPDPGQVLEAIKKMIVSAVPKDLPGPPTLIHVSFKTFIELEVVNGAQKPLAGESYKVIAANGEVREGKLDQDGKARIDGILAGPCRVRIA